MYRSYESETSVSVRCQPRYYWAKKRREIREKGKKCKKSARAREREREGGEAGPE